MRLRTYLLAAILVGALLLATALLVYFLIEFAQTMAVMR